MDIMEHFQLIIILVYVNNVIVVFVKNVHLINVLNVILHLNYFKVFVYIKNYH